DKLSREHLEWSVKSLMNSFLGTTGQRCTNTRRLIVRQPVLEEVVALLRRHIEQFMQASYRDGAFDPANEYGYGPLIDEDAFLRFEDAKKQAVAEGGKILFGGRLGGGESFYVEPAVAIMPAQTAVMHKE